MTDLDSLLRASAPEEELPKSFIKRVIERIDAQMKRKERFSLILSSFTLAGMLILAFYSASLLLTDLITAQTFEFFSFALSDIRMLAIAEGWLAILESIPWVTSLLVILTLTITGFALRSFLRASHIISFSPPRYAH